MMHCLQHRAFALFAFLAMVSSLRTPIRAQTSSESVAIRLLVNMGAIDGTAVDTTDTGFAGVEVVLLDTKQSVLTNKAGAYRIAGVEPGSHLIRFRRVGLQPVTVLVDVAENDVTGVDAVMTSLHQLQTVEIKAKNGRVMLLPKEFVEHMRSATGRYLTQDDIQRRHALSAGELFRGIPGLQIKPGPTPGSIVVVSARGINSFYADPCLSGIPIYLNGVQKVGSDITPAGSTPIQSLDIVAPDDIAAIEVYAGPGGVPATVPPSACGAIIIWTK